MKLATLLFFSLIQISITIQCSQFYTDQNYDQKQHDYFPGPFNGEKNISETFYGEYVSDSDSDSDLNKPIKLKTKKTINLCNIYNSVVKNYNKAVTQHNQLKKNFQKMKHWYFKEENKFLEMKWSNDQLQKKITSIKNITQKLKTETARYIIYIGIHNNACKQERNYKKNHNIKF
ncbi:hypothetical protein KAH94_05825 [bacterium]|nr:hypothetical protein [bacterium]